MAGLVLSDILLILFLDCATAECTKIRVGSLRLPTQIQFLAKKPRTRCMEPAMPKRSDVGFQTTILDHFGDHVGIVAGCSTQVSLQS
jgi:hypothetical protein